MKQKCGLFNAFKHLVIDKVLFPYPYSLLPEELMHSIFKKLVDRQVISVSPDNYWYLLQILCCYQVGDHRGAENAIRDFELKIK